LILITGASGYIGGRLATKLETSERRVRLMARRPELLGRRFAAHSEVVAGDVLKSESLQVVLADVDTAFYFIHSMGSAGSFVQEDRSAAENFAVAARAAGVRRIVYLGGLGEEADELSDHLSSRHEVGEVLRQFHPEVIELRASVVIGSGSLSFEMIRALVERLPIMITPKWVDVPTQPIAVGDILAFLEESIDLAGSGHRVFEVGGADVVTYGDMMRTYARARGLHRLMLRVPVLTPRLSSLWLGLVTPLYARVGQKLIDSIRHPTVVHDVSAQDAFSVRPMGLEAAIQSALRNEDREVAETRWSDAISAVGRPRDWGGVRFGNRLTDAREIAVEVSNTDAFAAIRRIGGETGWYYGDWLWKLRGWIDLLVGGVGLRRGRSHPDELRVGDAVDCWRTEAVERDRLVRFSAEMKLPGRAWLEFEVRGNEGHSTIHQTAIFDPKGLWGLLYWYGIYPLHIKIFGGMLDGVAREARRIAAARQGSERSI
jgi:uncharacterized protein YbjT (DUF2867 family)